MPAGRDLQNEGMTIELGLKEWRTGLMIFTAEPTAQKRRGFIRHKNGAGGYGCQLLRLTSAPCQSATAAGFRFTFLRVLFDEFNHQPGNVFLGGGLDTFQSR